MITVIANLKGGTGKSTVTFNLAVWLHSTGRRTTVTDLDPQRTLSDAAALRMEEGIEPPIHVDAGTFSDVTLPENAEEIIIDVGASDLGSFKQAIMIADPRVLTKPRPQVWTLDFEGGSVALGARCWADNAKYWLTRCDLTEKIKLRFDHEGIRMALPMQKVYLNSQSGDEPGPGGMPGDRISLMEAADEDH